MLIVSKKPLRYTGKCREQANALVRGGTRVGMVWYAADSCTFFCHICKKDQSYPTFNSSPVDEMHNCPGCKTPFVFAEVN